MRADIYPLQVLLLTVSGWVNRHQANVIEYLVEQSRVLEEQLRGRKLQLTNDQRRRLAARAKLLGRRVLDRVATIVTPDTLMRWHHRLIALKWTYETKRVGRPGLMKAIAALIVQMARDNSSWGYCRIPGELKGIGHIVASTTIANVLKANGIKPAPDRPSSWKSFLKAHWGEIAGMDFFTAEVWTPTGLKTYYVLFLVDLKTRRVNIAGVTTNPGEAFIAQVARNLTDLADGFLRAHRFLICERDTKFTAQFKRILKDSGIEVILTPRQAPNCKAFAERFVLSIKSECLWKMIFFGETSLRRAVSELVAHNHVERAHQGLGTSGLSASVPGEARRCRLRRASWRFAQVLPPRGVVRARRAEGGRQQPRSVLTRYRGSVRPTAAMIRVPKRSEVGRSTGDECRSDTWTGRPLCAHGPDCQLRGAPTSPSARRWLPKANGKANSLPHADPSSRVQEGMFYVRNQLGSVPNPAWVRTFVLYG